MTLKERQLRAACELVEAKLRAIAGTSTCTLSTLKDGTVEIARDSWSGSCVEKNLYIAIKEALREAEQS